MASDKCDTEGDFVLCIVFDFTRTIAVVYTPWRMPWFWRPMKEFRFITKKLSDGKIYWVPTPLNR